ncbi:MAG: ribonuclease HI [Deltaproteobacteria bacterium]|nr:ribonuclease HI [Deltaproteobacteria bacterium]
MTRDHIEIYTDGACSGNPGPAGAGAILRWNGHEKELSVYLGEATSNIAELMAVRLALESVKNRKIPVRIHLDSTYTLGILSLGWKAKANQQLVAEVRALVKTFTSISFIKVPGHAGVPLNERADELARAAIERGG